VYEKYKGLPVDWAKVSALMVADSLINSGETDKAEAMYREFEQLYPGGGGLQAKVGRARIAVAKKDLLSAKDTLASVTEEALKLKTVPRENAFAYSQAFYVMGLVNEADGKPQEALENYLRTVTIFYNDPNSRAAAQERADELRARNKGRKASDQLTVP
jgi:tetratricopeptide (TPR) repeat protein